MPHIAEESIVFSIDDGRLVPAGLAAEHSSIFLCSTVTCYPCISLGWRCLCQLASVLGVRSISFIGARALSRDLIVCLSVVKRVHPVGNEIPPFIFLIGAHHWRKAQ